MIRRAFSRVWENVTMEDMSEALPLHSRLLLRFPRLTLVVLMPFAFIEDLIRYREPRWRYWLLWRDALLGRDLESSDPFHPRKAGKVGVCFPDGSEHIATFSEPPEVGESLDVEFPDEVVLTEAEWTVRLVAISLGDDYEYYVEVESPKGHASGSSGAS